MRYEESIIRGYGQPCAFHIVDRGYCAVCYTPNTENHTEVTWPCAACHVHVHANCTDFETGICYDCMNGDD